MVIQIPNPRLSSTETNLLIWLLHHPFQRPEDIAIGVSIHVRVAYRNLIALVEKKWVAWVEPGLDAHTTTRWYYLTNSGLREVASREEATLAQIAREWGAHEQGLLSLLSCFPALAFLQDIVNGLMEHAPTTCSRVSGTPDRIAWHWTRGYEHTFRFHNKEETCWADAVVAFRLRATTLKQIAYPDDRLHRGFFLFVDSSEEGFFSQEVIMDRLEKLVWYRECEEREPIKVFPPVLVVCTSPRQVELWRKGAQEVIIRLGVRTPLEGAIVRISPTILGRKTSKDRGKNDLSSKENQKKEILSTSLWSLDWRSLTTGHACKLQDVLIPMERAALPAGLYSMQRVPASSTPKKHALVRGEFEMRWAKLDLTVGSQVKEREVLAFLGLKMSRRYRAVLHLLAMYPLLPARSLAAFLESKGLKQVSKAEASAKTTQRYLSQLRQWGCVHYISVQGEQWLWLLTPRGLRLLAAMYCVDPSLLLTDAHHVQATPNITISQRGVYTLYQSLDQTLSMYEFLAELCKKARERGDHMVWWEIGERASSSYYSNGEWHTLQSGAAFEYEVVAQDFTTRIVAWVEWYHTPLNETHARACIQRYQEAVAVGIGGTRRIHTTPFLLLIVPENQRPQPLIEAMTERRETQRLQVCITTPEQYGADGPLGEIWTSIWPRQQDAQPRRFVDVS